MLDGFLTPLVGGAARPPPKPQRTEGLGAGPNGGTAAGVGHDRHSHDGTSLPADSQRYQRGEICDPGPDQIGNFV